MKDGRHILPRERLTASQSIVLQKVKFRKQDY